MKKLLRVTTADISLDGLLEGQLRFLNRHYEVVGVAADTGVLGQVGRREGIRVVDVPMHREISLFADLRCLWLLIALFRRERPHIVHANTPKGSLLAMVAARLTRVPHRIYTVTGLRYQGTCGVLRLVLKTMERITCLCANKVVPEGNGVKRALVADRITGKPLEVVHFGNINGRDTSYFSPAALDVSRGEMRGRLGFAADDFVFVFIGRIVRDKGMDELAAVMRRLAGERPNAKLLLVGSFETELDPLDDGNEDFFRSSGNVVYVGVQKDVRPYLLASDALVFPSYREGFPNVPIEAGSMGLPSIVTDINGCNEIIEDGKNGKIIPPRDEHALHRMMLRFADNRSEAQRMASNARPMVQARYEQKDVWAALLDMYEAL